MRKEINYIVIDGVPSTDFGIYVTNAGSYKVPQKDYDLKAVSGRNGAVYLDHGRWENVEIKYPAFVVGDFQSSYDEFIALLMSKKGYFRLEDTIRPDIYREGVFVGSVEPKMSRDGKMGVFTITFSCKPQKFLKYGEEVIEEPSGAVLWHIINPTLFPASPLIEVYGYGGLWINGYHLTVTDTQTGMIEVVDFRKTQSSLDLYGDFQDSNFNANDTAYIEARWWAAFKIIGAQLGTITFEDKTTNPALTTTSVINDIGEITIGVTYVGTFSIQAQSAETLTATVRVHYTNQSNVVTYEDVDVSLTFTSATEYVKLSGITLSSGLYSVIRETRQIEYVKVNSTVSALGNPMYVDMETGDAYKYVYSEKVYVNQSIWVGEKLPVLEPGSNLIVPEGEHITVKIIPRWWTI